MPQKTSPFLEGKWGWNYGESGWNSGADENWLKFSYMFDANVDAIVSTLPVAVNGEAYFLTTDNRLYFVVDGTYYSTPVPKWFEFKIKSTGEVYKFNGTAVVTVPDTQDLDNRVDTLESDFDNLSDPLIATNGAALIARGGQVVDSVAAIRLLSKDSPSKFAFATAHTSARQGLGGGPYRLDEDDTTSVDNNGTIIVANDGGRWKLLHNGGVTIHQFGGVGDGVTDDTAAIIDWLAASISQAFVALVGHGIFVSTSEVTNSLTGDQAVAIKGSGTGVSVLLVKSGGNGYTFNLPGNYSLFKTGPGRTAFAMEGVTVATTNALVGYGINLLGNHVSGRPSAKTYFRDVEVTSYNAASGQFFEIGIRLQNMSFCHFDSIRCYMGAGNTTSYGVHSFSTGSGTGGGALNFIHPTFLWGARGVSVGDFQEGVYLSNPEFVGCVYGVYYSPTTITESGLHIMGGHFACTTANIFANRLFHFEIVGGLYFDNSSGTFTHIELSNVNYYTITGNVFNGNGSGLASIGIRVVGQALQGNGGGGCCISGNHFARMGIGISKSSSSSYMKESSNTYVGCATRVSAPSDDGTSSFGTEEYHASVTVSLTTGATSESIDIPIKGMFGAAPITAQLTISNAGFQCRYIPASSNATSLRFDVSRTSGAALPITSMTALVDCYRMNA